MKPNSNASVGNQNSSNILQNPQIISQQDIKPQQPQLMVGGSNGGVGTSGMNNFFNSRGPIRPQFLVGPGGAQPLPGTSQQASTSEERARSNSGQRVIIPQARDFIKDPSVISPPSQHSSGNRLKEEYYGEEEDDYGDEERLQSSARGMRQLAPHEEQEIIAGLVEAGARNREFAKVMNILQNDSELRPLIFEHEILLRSLTVMNDLKAEFMLSILTAAETEMYENSKQKQDQNELTERNRKLTGERDHFYELLQQANEEIARLQNISNGFQEESTELKALLAGERTKIEVLEKEREVMFKNLQDENLQLKKSMDQQKRTIESKDKEYYDDLENLKRRLSQQEQARLSLINEKDKLELEMREMKERMAKEILYLERENENLHRKLNSTFNSALLQSQLQVISKQPVIKNEGEQERELSLSFQGSRILAEDPRNDINGQAALYYGNTTQNIRLLLSGDNQNKLSSGNNSIIAYPRGSSGLHDFSTNPFGQGGENQKSLGRSTSIEVLLLDKAENRKQSRFALQEDSHSSGPERANRDYVQSRGFLEMPPNKQPLTQYLGTSLVLDETKNYTQPIVRQLEERLKNLINENDSLRQENKVLKDNSYQQLGQVGTPRIGGEMSSERSAQKVGSSRMYQQNDDPNIALALKGEFKSGPEISYKENNYKSHHNSHGSVQLSTALMGKSSQRDGSGHPSSHREKDLENQIIEQRSKIHDLGNRLFSVFKKFQPSYQELARFQIGVEFTVPIIKELIYEISLRAEAALDNQSSIKPSHFYHQNTAALNTIGASLTPMINNQYQQSISPQGAFTHSGTAFNQHHHFQPAYHPTSQQQAPPQFNNFMSHPQQQQVNHDPEQLLVLREQIVQEKEHKIRAQEELAFTKLKMTEAFQECERAKRQIEHQAQQMQEMQHTYYRNAHTKYDQNGFDNIRQLEIQYEEACEEVTNLKIRIASLESDLFDERRNKEMKLEATIKDCKVDFQDQFMEYKLKFDQLLMIEKEKYNKLKLESHRLSEDYQTLKRQLLQTFVKNEDLEKENYNLQNELDQELIKGLDHQVVPGTRNKTPEARGQERAKINQIFQRTDERVRTYQRTASQWETRAKRAEDRESMIRLQNETELQRLKTDIEILISENKKLKGIKEMSNAVNSSSPGAIETSLFKGYQQKLSAYKLTTVLQVKQLKTLASSLFKIAVYQREKSNMEGVSGAALSMSMLDDNKQTTQKIQLLEDQVQNLQNQNTVLLAQVGKILRFINSNRQIKVSMSGLVSSYNIDYLLTGLKNNTEVFELTLSNCGLIDSDLQKIAETMKTDSYIVNLKLQRNNFTSLQPLIELFMNQHTKGSHIQELDISNIPLEFRLLDHFKQTIEGFSSLQRLSLAQCFCSGTKSPQGKLQTIEKVDQLLLKIISLDQLKALDISKNKFYPENLATFFKNMRLRPNIKTLVMSSLDGFNEENASNFIEMLRDNKGIKQLNIAGSIKLANSQVLQIVSTITEASVIEELDMSQCNFDGRFKEVAEMIAYNKNLKSLTLQKVNMNDTNASVLVQPLADAFNLENLKLDFNQLGSVFIERLSSKILQNPLQNQLPGRQITQNQHNTTQSEASFMTEESGGLHDFRNSNSTQNLRTVENSNPQGLNLLSFEGNTQLGDRGAKALADVIRTPNNNTKQLTMVNLNDCGITNEGFDELKSALFQRGNLAQVANLTHVKIKIERNPIGGGVGTESNNS